MVKKTNSISSFYYCDNIFPSCILGVLRPHIGSHGSRPFQRLWQYAVGERWIFLGSSITRVEQVVYIMLDECMLLMKWMALPHWAVGGQKCPLSRLSLWALWMHVWILQWRGIACPCFLGTYFAKHWRQPEVRSAPPPFPQGVHQPWGCRVPVGERVSRDPGKTRRQQNCGEQAGLTSLIAAFHQLLQPDFMAFYSVSSWGNIIKYYERTIR